MRKKNLWKKTASVLIAAAMIMTSVPVYAGTLDETENGVIVQESTDEAEDELQIQEDVNIAEEKTGDDTEETEGALIGSISAISSPDSIEIQNESTDNVTITTAQTIE